MSPPSTRLAIPWTTAFSTKGCKSSGGTFTASTSGEMIFFHAHAIAETNFFHREECVDQRQFLFQRYGGLFAQAEGAAQEIREEDAHFAGF